jgi:hypothetical protein
MTLHINPTNYQIERAPCPVMTTSAQIYTLREAYVTRNPHFAKVIYPHPLSYPTEIAHVKSPGKLDPNMRLYHHTASDRRAEQP